MHRQAIHLLIIESNAADARLLERALSQSNSGQFIVETVSRFSDALAAIERRRPDVIALDLSLPDSNGIESVLQLQAAAPGTPIIILADLEDEIAAPKAVQSGVHDYLLKRDLALGPSPAPAILNIVERSRALAKSPHVDHRLALAADASELGFWDWDLRTNRLFLSHHALTIFGMEPDRSDCSFDHFEQCLHPDDQHAVEKRIQDIMVEREPHGGFAYRIVWSDGSVRWVESRGRTMFDENAQAHRMTGTILDITDRKMAEEAKRRDELELAHLCRVSTIGHVASGLAHELSHPLTAILNYASACEEYIGSHKKPPARVITGIQGVMNETRRAGSITHRMFAFLRNQPQRCVPLDVNEVVRQAIDSIEFELQYRRLRPQLDLPAGLPDVSADPMQLSQAMTHLLLNALEAMGAKRSADDQLTVQTAVHEQGRSVLVSITDTGPGIAPENMRRIFEPFYSTKSGSLGMGLNIARSIVESHGGRLQLESNGARGMRFYFTIPVIESESR